MTDRTWEQIREVFEAALAIEPAERDAFLRKRCADDTGLRSEVESLLASHEETGKLDELASALGDSTVSRLLRGPSPGDRVDNYRIVRELGRGGMGAVYLAERDQPSLRQQVALKILQLGVDSDELLRRFFAERQILAGLQHVNIALLLDGGATGDGLPYFTMEYVDGRPIDVHCEEEGLGRAERIALLIRVCDAVEYAHQRGVIHRDLKPGNILVRRDGVPKVLDFGIARLVDRRGEPSAHATLTRTDQRRLTLEYASPEQISGDEITPASDVYSLGVLLHRLLTGRPPVDTAGLTAGEAEVRLSDPVVEAPGLGLALDAALLSALEKDPGLRPPTAGALAAALRHATDAGLERGGSAAAATAGAATGSPTGARWLGAAAIAALLVGGYSVWSATRADPTNAAAGASLGVSRAASPAADAGAADSGREQILWVDDRPDNNRRELDVLWNRGFDVITVRSTEEALRLYRADRFIGVVSDMERWESGEYRPEAGLALLQELRSRNPDVHLSFYTSPATVRSMRDRMMEAGAAAIPATTEELVEIFETARR